ncbi:hypothetical protein TUMEXPCC7403_17020 [Tumidithrix helvetica PCC 7403]|uniref:hypothetical protein n=1 Tax=Tumidithrix helvetica TaxID=3457545 RepID=UPI003C970BF8
MRHSELTTDLHYAKAKVFTGLPSNVTADFADQILIGSDKRLYRAISTTQGDLELLVADSAQGAFLFGDGLPTSIPEKQGLQYWDWRNRKLYFSRHMFSIGGWVNTSDDRFSNLFVNDLASFTYSELSEIRVYHSPLPSASIESGFDFGEPIAILPSPNSNPMQFDLGSEFGLYGSGCWAFKVIWDSGSSYIPENLKITSASTNSGTSPSVITATGVLTSNDGTLGINFVEVLPVLDNTTLNLDFNWYPS